MDRRQRSREQNWTPPVFAKRSFLSLTLSLSPQTSSNRTATLMQVATEASGSRQGSTDPNGGASSSIPQPRGECLPGCYTVVWSPRPTRDEPHYIKLAPTFGDGDTSRWPEEGPEMTLLDNDHDKQRMWRKTAGEMLAKDLGHHNSKRILPLLREREIKRN